MGIFNRGKGKAENTAQQDPNLAPEDTDQTGQQAGQEDDQMTGGGSIDQSRQGMQTAQNTVGQQAGPQDPMQDQNQGYQDPNQGGYQNPGQGSGQGGYQDQGQNQDPDQGYQDQNQAGYQGQNQGDDQGQDQNQAGYDPNQGQGQGQSQGL